MGDITNTDANVRALNGAIVQRGEAGGSGYVGDAVYLDGTNGWKQADADAEASSQARGVVVGVKSEGSTSFADGDAIDIVTEGPVEGFASMTPGGAVFVSTTAGALDQTAPATAGDYPFAIGWARSASVLYVHPQSHVPTVNAG